MTKMNFRLGIGIAVAAALASTASAQDQELRRLSRRCGSEIEWLRDTPPPRTESPRWQPDEGDRSKLWQEALDKARAEGRPILLYLYRIDGRQMYRAPCLDNYMMNAIFTDPDVVGIVRRRFVAVRMLSNPSLPLGIRPPDAEVRGTLEPALVFVSTDGKVVHAADRIRTFNADWVAQLLRDVLRKVGAAAPAVQDPAELIAAGEYERAREILSKRDDAESRYLLATVLRRLRDGEGALAALKGIDTPDAAVERALVLYKQGRLDEARKGFDEAISRKPSRLPEALFHRACLQFYAGDSGGAIDRFRELAREHGDSAFAWRGAAEFTNFKDTTPDGPLSHYFFDPFWHPAEAYAGMGTTTAWPGGARPLPQVAARAVRWLLLHQRANGGFDDTRYAFWDSPKILPNVRMASTALAAAALLEWRDADPERIDRAVAAAERYIFDDANLARNENEECYAHAYRLVYLARKAGRDRDAGAHFARKIDEIVGRLGRIVTRDGWWAHEYPNAFATAAVVQALAAARDAGSQSAGDLIKRGAAALQRSRGDGGVQPYSAGGERMSSAKDSSGRAPMCEAAIALGGLAPVSNVAAALKTYWEYYENQEKVRLCDFHTDGELGGFFFLHNMFHATEAVKLLPKEERRKELARFREALLKLPELDGSFLDDHEIGKSYGTAMGLLILRNCVE
jgi:tetratricopeptide (TPR) repeat protein